MERIIYALIKTHTSRYTCGNKLCWHSYVDLFQTENKGDRLKKEEIKSTGLEKYLQLSRSMAKNGIKQISQKWLFSTKHAQASQKRTNLQNWFPMMILGDKKKEKEGLPAINYHGKKKTRKVLEECLWYCILSLA